MKYLLIENEEGQYIKINGTERYNILECHEAIGPRANDFQEYANIEQAMKAYGVEEYHEPVIEEPQEEESEQPQEQEEGEQETQEEQEEEIEEEQEQPSEEENTEETEQEEPVEVEE